MRLPFIELLELEQRVALTAAIVRRLGDMDLLAESAIDRDPVEVARDVIGVTDMDAAERWAAVNAAVSVGARALDAAAIITTDWVAPTMASLAENTSRTAKRLGQRRARAYVRAGSTALGAVPTEEVNDID